MTEDPIKVSVALISYKHVKYIRKCLDSILEQKVNFRYEVIIAEDCSNDGTKEILLEYRQKYPDIIFPIFNCQNMGGSNNCYIAYSACRGEYLCLGETDDFWTDPYRLQKQADYLDSHPDISAVGSNHYFVNDDGIDPKIILCPWQVNKRYKLKDYLKYGYIIHGNSLMVRASVFPGADEKFKALVTAEPTMVDVIYRIMIYDAGDIYVFPDIMHAHRNGASCSTSYSYMQKSKIIEYSYMYCRIVDNITNYYNGRLDISELKSNRTALVLFEIAKGRINVAREEKKKYLSSLPVKIRAYAFFKAVELFARRAVHKLWRTLFGKSSIQLDENIK